MHEKLIRTVAQIIKENRYLTLATCINGVPWAAPVAYTVDPDFTFVFFSALSARHTQHLIGNPIVAGAIFNSTESSESVGGLQFLGQCSEVAPAELPEVMDRYFTLSFPDPEVRARWVREAKEFAGSAPQRFFKIQLLELGTGDPNSVKIDKRIVLNVEDVKRSYFKQIAIL